MNAKLRLRVTFLVFLVAAFTFYINGCKEGDAVVASVEDNVELSVVSTTESTAPISLEIDQAKLLIKDIKLNAAGGGESNYKVGPFMLLLDLASNCTFVTSSYVNFGTYDKLKFEIHKLNNNEPLPDPDFADSSGRYSIVVKGRVDGISFTFKSALSAHQIRSFPSPMVVTTAGKVNISLKAKPYMWFMKNGVMLDPLNELNRNDIELNIKNNINENIRIFVDNDKNGQPD
jgi:hypothetical protein